RGARNRSRLRWFGLRLGTFGLDGLRGGAKVALDFSFFALRHAFPENVLIFCVRLRQVVEAEALPVLQIPAAFRVPLQQQFETPFDFAGRALPAAPEEGVVLDLQLPDIALKLRQIFVDSGHGASLLEPPC